jgi:hypothetical protein
MQPGRRPTTHVRRPTTLVRRPTNQEQKDRTERPTMESGRRPPTQVRRITNQEQKGQLFRLAGSDPSKDSKVQKDQSCSQAEGELPR